MHISFKLNNTTWTMSDHLFDRMDERGMDEFDIKCALKYGKSFPSFEDKEATLTISVIDEADYEGQRTAYGTRATHLIVVHKKNKFGVGREIMSCYYADRNNAKIRHTLGK